MTPEAIAVLRLRQIAARASVAKYDALLERADADDLLRHTFQFAGAQRTNRWAGRGFQPTNLARTPPWLADDAWLHAATEAIRAGDLDLLELIAGEPMDTLAGLPRSAIRTDDDEEIRAADLNAIETRVSGWVSGCKPLNEVFAKNLDPYKAFAVDLFGVPYEQITKAQRNAGKVPVLSCVFGTGGGTRTRKGLLTGLWAQAENMGVNWTREESRNGVKLWLDKHVEITDTWAKMRDAAWRCLRTKKPVEVNEWLRYEYRDPYLILHLPYPNACIYYADPRIVQTWFAKHPKTEEVVPLRQNEHRAARAKSKGWEVYDKQSLSYMGREQDGHGWVRVYTYPPKQFENMVQRVARDVLKDCMLAAADEGFDIRFHNYDEIATIHRLTDKVHTVDRLKAIMSRPLPWAPGLLLGAAGWAGPFYKKD